MKKILYMLILVLAVSLVAAQDTQQDSKNPAAEETTDQQKSPGPAAAKTTDNKSNTPETFIPSEEISEDLSVSFPVDI